MRTAFISCNLHILFYKWSKISYSKMFIRLKTSVEVGIHGSLSVFPSIFLRINERDLRSVCPILTPYSLKTNHVLTFRPFFFLFWRISDIFKPTSLIARDRPFFSINYKRVITVLSTILCEACVILLHLIEIQLLILSVSMFFVI